MSDNYFPVDKVWEYLARYDEYYKLKSTYRLNEEEFEKIKKGPKLHVCKECKLKYDYYAKVGKLVARDEDLGTETELSWRECTHCSLGYDLQMAADLKNLSLIHI